MAGYPRDDPFTVVPARVGDDQLAQAPDIYQSKEVTRQIYSIRADVEPGNSGGPLLAPSGQVDGVVFAAAVGVKDTGYALTASEVRGRRPRRGRPPGPPRLHPGRAHVATRPAIWRGLRLARGGSA